MAVRYVTNPAPDSRLTLKGAKKVANKKSSPRRASRGSGSQRSGGGNKSGRSKTPRKNPAPAAVAAPVVNGRRSRRARRNPARQDTIQLFTKGATGAIGVAIVSAGLGLLPLPGGTLGRAGVKLGAAFGLHQWGGKAIGQNTADTIALILIALATGDVIAPYVSQITARVLPQPLMIAPAAQLDESSNMSVVSDGLGGFTLADNNNLGGLINIPKDSILWGATENAY